MTTSDRTPGIVTFVERRGARAGVLLDALARRLAARGWTVRRLAHVDDASVQLLTVEGDVDLDPTEVHGAQIWRFSEVPDVDSPQRTSDVAS